MSTYLSPEGLEKLKQEYDDRKKRVRHELSEKIAAAKELGDLSENFEYQEAKDAQGMNEMRLVDLEGMIKDHSLVEQQKGGTIGLGSHFVTEANGTERSFEIVGSNEAEPLKGKISNESPIGMAFIGHNQGETIEVNVPSGTMKYKILKVK